MTPAVGDAGLARRPRIPEGRIGYRKDVADVEPPWPDAELAASREDAELVISVSGDVDLATAPSVERVVKVWPQLHFTSISL